MGEPHRFEEVIFSNGSHFCALCSCGWRSDPTTTAGLAGSLWDVHHDDLIDLTADTVAGALPG